jgi:S1-C subfamily serine protease
MMRSVLRSPLFAALLAGGVVAAVLLLAGVGTDNKTVTVIQPTSAATPTTPSSVSAAAAKGLSAHDIYVRDAPGVVYITSTVVDQQSSSQSTSPFDLFPQQEEQGTATGSGIVLNKDGTILTNWHVIEGAVKINVRFGSTRVQARVIGTDPSDDLALLRVPTDGLMLHPLPLGDSDNVLVGDPTYAIGDPFGLSGTLTTGVVSAEQRSITAPNGFTIDNVIQTDAPINPGNSGGPLLNSKGQVIGINSQIETGGSSSGGSVGIGFAIPIDTARNVIPQLETTGKVQEAYLGLVSATIDSSLASLHLGSSSGALVESVEAGTPAARAGIRGGDISSTTSDGDPIELGGDIITAVNGVKVDSSADLANIIAAKKPGETVTLTLLRASPSKTVKVSIKLASRPNSVPNPDTPQG